MENQHRLITGYRDLSEDEIALMNEIKEHGVALGTLVAKVRATPNIDPRWAAIGGTHFQEGLMALTRSVARPETF